MVWAVVRPPSETLLAVPRMTPGVMKVERLDKVDPLEVVEVPDELFEAVPSAAVDDLVLEVKVRAPVVLLASMAVTVLGSSTGPANVTSSRIATKALTRHFAWPSFTVTRTHMR